MTKQRSGCWTWNLVLLGAVLLAALALRLFYAAHASLYIDEFTTIWAAQRVLAQGLPRFPLGAIYPQGLLYTYLDAGALIFGGGFHPVLARLPSLVLSAVTLALTVYAARRLFHTLPVGLAALWLAVDGEAKLAPGIEIVSRTREGVGIKIRGVAAGVEPPAGATTVAEPTLEEGYLAFMAERGRADAAAEGVVETEAEVVS